MPLHIAAHLRALEETLEVSGLVKPLDSVAVANAKIAEAAGLAVKVVPIGFTTGKVVNGKLVTVK